MDWVEEELTQFKYECENGHLSIYVLKSKEQDYSVKRQCMDCDQLSNYAGFIAKPINLTAQVAFDQNGRKAYRITDGQGRVTHISQSKFNYLKSGGEVAKPVYTRDYENHLRDTGKEDLLEKRYVAEERKALNKRRAEAKGRTTPGTPAALKEG